MFSEKYHLDTLSPTEFDDFLAQGWYPMGQTIFTTHFLCFFRQFYSAIWIRLPLEGYQYSKSLRKLRRRNQERFRIEVNPATFTEEKEALFQRYRLTFSGSLPQTLSECHFDQEENNIFDTREVTVYDQERLIACSYFHLGARGAASIQGFYDPDYSSYSLGLYTMLEEISFCMDSGIDFFYPGYVVPGYDRFDYKLRIGPVDYYELTTQQWLPYHSLKPDNLPLTIMETRLHQMLAVLYTARLPGKLMYYPLFEVNFYSFAQAPYLRYPVFLLCSIHPEEKTYIIIVYDLLDQAYKLMRCYLLPDLGFSINQEYINYFDPMLFFMEPIVEGDILLESPNPEYLALGLHKLHTIS
jgi:leucyl-tRNA---protein transferase